MATSPHLPEVFEFILQVERFYAGLILAAGHGPDAEPSLGGKLLYAGQLDSQSRALLVAANIAGAASLALSADAAAGKQAVRDGVVNFLVTSLDEALRILKNEIRKRSSVAVCVALESNSDFARQLLERGVLPDLLPPRSAPAPEFAVFLSQGARPVVAVHPDANQALLAWSVASAPAQWLPKLDALALSCLDENMGAPGPGSPRTGLRPWGGDLDSETWDSARRWLRLAPRNLGRRSQSVRLFRCSESIAASFLEGVRKNVAHGEIGVPVEITIYRNEQPEFYSFTPPSR
jgi:urocanate hydratase